MPVNSDTVFTETQIFSTRSRFIATLLSVLSVIGLIYILATPLNTVPEPLNIGLFLSFCVMIIVDMFVFLCSLTIRIDEEGILLKEKPSKFKLLCQWENIDQMFIRYNFLKIRSSTKNGMGYNLKAKQGIQIIFKNGDKIQIGIQNMEVAKLAIGYYRKAKIPDFKD